MERDEDFFDFTEQIFDEPSIPNQKDDTQTPNVPLTLENEVHTSYLLVNALLNLLLNKGVIFPHEVKFLVEELHQEYLKKKGRDADGIT